jgi:hypothetical protein
MKKLILTLIVTAGAIIAHAGDYTITPDYSKPNWNMLQAYVVKDANTGAVVASWSRPNSNTWAFHDPYNKISVHIIAYGTVSDWTFN